MTIKSSTIKFIWLTISGFCLIVLLFYIFQVGALAQDEYLVKDYQKKLSQISKDNKFLDINFSKESSLSNIENYLADENFVKTNQVKYIQIRKGAVVSK